MSHAACWSCAAATLSRGVEAARFWKPRGHASSSRGCLGAAHAAWQDATTLALEVDGWCLSLVVVRAGTAWQVFYDVGAETDAGRYSIEVIDPLAPRSAEGTHESHLRAPMPGRIVSLLAQPGSVERGAPLLVLEAMKMEHTVTAPASGVLEAFHVQPGDQVAEGSDLVTFHAAAPAAPR